jgi:CPA1 family monovalent cation:H+ antiporter
MSWAGMRGVVSLAAALALPDHFPGRDVILIITFVVILVTVLVQGSTLCPMILRLRLQGFSLHRAVTLDEDTTRARIAAVQLAAVEKESLQADGTHLHPRLFEQYSYRARASARYSEAAQELSVHRNAHFGVVLTAIDAGRHELLRLHRAGEIHDKVLHAVEEELDLEEMRVRRWIGEAG